MLAAGVESEPDTDALVLLGVLYHRAGRNAEAENAFLAALDLEAENARAHMNLGLVLFEQEAYEAASVALRDALQLDDSLAYAHFALGILLMDYLGDASAAADAFERYRELGGSDGRVSEWLGRLGR